MLHERLSELAIERVSFADILKHHINRGGSKRMRRTRRTKRMR
jgi:hypothetical protein